MKLPKIKHYYLAMTSDAYIDFAVTRVVRVDAAYSIDLLTGAVTGITQLRLATSVPAADTYFRAQHSDYDRPVYVLRIPREYIDRTLLHRIDADLYSYTGSLLIPHCAVERVEYDPDSRVDSVKVIDTAELKHI